jgi:hypothetical protein
MVSSIRDGDASRGTLGRERGLRRFTLRDGDVSCGTLGRGESGERDLRTRRVESEP